MPHVSHHAAAGRARRDDGDSQLRFRQPKRFECQLSTRLQPLELLGHRHAVHAASCNHEESDRMDWHQRTGRQHRALHAFLSARFQPGGQIGQQAQIADRFGRLGADRQRPACLGDNHPDLAGAYLNPRMLLDDVEDPQSETPARHQQFALIARLAMKRNGIIVGQFLHGEPLDHQSDFRWANDVDRRQNDDHRHKHNKCQEGQERMRCAEQQECHERFPLRKG